MEMMQNSNLESISGEIIDQMKQDIMGVLMGYEEIDINKVKVDIFTPSQVNQQSMVIVANLPFKGDV